MRGIDIACLVMLTFGSFCSAQSRYYGAVDLGSKGAKGALYSFVGEEDGPNPVRIFSETINTRLISSMEHQVLTPDGIADAADAVKKIVDEMKAEAATQSINVDVYYIVGSGEVSRASNKPDLIDAVKQATGIDMEFVDAAHEGYYGLISAIPQRRRSTSMYVDIGSGNSKLGCLVGGEDFSSYKNAGIPYGSVSGRNEALKRTPSDLNAGIASVMADVNTTYEHQSHDLPCLRDRREIYWTGGVAWAIATFTHPESEMKGWVSLTRHDLDAFIASLKDNTWNQKNPVFNFPQDTPLQKQNAVRAKAAKSRADVQNVFAREDLLSGLAIMQTILDSHAPPVKLYFVRSANFIFGYALAKYDEALLSSSEVPSSTGRAVAQLSPAQVQTLETAKILLRARSDQLKKFANPIDKTDSLRLRGSVKQVLMTCLEELDTTEARIHEESFAKKAGNPDEPVRLFFEDLRLNYRLSLIKLDVVHDMFPSQVHNPVKPVSFPLRESMEGASDSDSVLVQDGLNAIADNELAYAVAADSSRLGFDLRIYSVPEGATIEYKRRGDTFKTNPENTNSVINSLVLAIWIVHVSKDGYQDQEIEYDPFREREHRIDVVLKKRG
jgi:hypothetical protein